MMAAMHIPGDKHAPAGGLAGKGHQLRVFDEQGNDVTPVPLLPAGGKTLPHKAGGGGAGASYLDKGGGAAGSVSLAPTPPLPQAPPLPVEENGETGTPFLFFFFFFFYSFSFFFLLQFLFPSFFLLVFLLFPPPPPPLFFLSFLGHRPFFRVPSLLSS
ncbi:MAG: hypothetical protein BJ554DRAFT_5558, partial [Olpidium bornovanus]